MRKLSLLIALVAVLLMMAPAWGQFLGYVGQQSVRVIALTAVNTTGPSAIIQDVGQGAHELVYCVTSGTATQVAIQLEGSVDGVTFFPISVQGTNTNGCAAITAGGWFPAIRANLVTYVPGVTRLTATYTGIATAIPGGGGNVLPLATMLASSGAVIPVQCDKTAVSSTVGPGAPVQVIATPANQGISLCGGIISFTATPTVGALPVRLIAGTGATCGTGTVIIWEVYPGTVNQPIPIAPGGGGSFVRVPSGANLCVSVDAGQAPSVKATISYAQF